MKCKKLLSALLVVMMALTFTACSNSSNSDDEKQPNKDKETTKLEDKVVIYSTHSEDLNELVATEFEKETGVKVEFINLKGELAERVRAEKDNPQADIMYGGASSLFMDLKAEDAFESFEPTWASNIDELYKDNENFWFGTIKTPVVLFYNTEVISDEDVPNDWVDLADEKYADQLIFRNALSSSARVMYSALLQQYEQDGNLEDGWKFMKAMDQNTKKYFDSGSLMMQSIGRKEAGISAAPLNDVIDNKLNNQIPIEFIDAESGSPVITDGIAIIKNAPHPEAAKAFLEFAGSAKVQSMLATEFNRIPTHPDAIANSPDWMGDVSFKAMDVDWVDLSAKMSEWMQKWDTEIKDSKKDVE